MIDKGTRTRYNTIRAKGHGVMVTRGSPKPLLRVRILLPLPPNPVDIDTMSTGLFLHL